MQCPNCGTFSPSANDYCEHCGTFLGAVLSDSPPKKSVFEKIIAGFLFLIAIFGICFSMTDTIRLSGTWVRYIQTEHTNIIIPQQYELTPFGIMSQSSGDTTVKGKYRLEKGVICFTPSQTEKTEKIPYRLTLDGKLYLNGEQAEPFMVEGISLSLMLFLISLLFAGGGVYFLRKKPKPKTSESPSDEEDETDEDDFDDEYDEEDEEEVSSPTPAYYPYSAEYETIPGYGSYTEKTEIPSRTEKREAAATLEFTGPFYRGGDL